MRQLDIACLTVAAGCLLALWCVTRSDEAAPPPSLSQAVTQRALEAPVPEVEALPAPRVAEAADARPEPVPPPVEAPYLDDGAIAGVRYAPMRLFTDLAEGWEPDAAGLFDQTSTAWSQEGFAQLSTERALALLPDAAAEIGTLPTTVSALVGGFPTIEDCERAYGSVEVRAAHLAYITQQLLVTEMQQRPFEERGADFTTALSALRTSRDHAELELMAACERATSYPHWRLCMRLFKAWSR